MTTTTPAASDGKLPSSFNNYLQACKQVCQTTLVSSRFVFVYQVVLPIRWANSLQDVMLFVVMMFDVSMLLLLDYRMARWYVIANPNASIKALVMF